MYVQNKLNIIIESMYNENEQKDNYLAIPKILKNSEENDSYILDYVYDILCLNFYPFNSCSDCNDTHYIDYSEDYVEYIG